MPHQTLSLLGTFCLTQAESPISGFGSDKVRALLAYLAVESNHPQRREKLAALLWSEQPEARARANLSQALYNLRQLLGEDCLSITPQSALILPDSALRVDVLEFERLLSGCGAHAPHRLLVCPECLQQVEQAIDLYRGNFIEGLTLRDEQEFEDWLTLEREKLRLKALEALQELAASYEMRNDLHAALHYARRAASLDPYEEQIHRLLLRLLALSGERNTALAHYEALHNQLAQELGVEPEPETQALYRQLKANDFTLPGSLPVSLTPFIGRQSELAALCGLLCNPGQRLISIVGMGGSGKSSLAIEVGRRLQAHFTAGVYFISLAAYQPGNPVWPLLADAMHLRVREKQDPEQQVLDYLRAKRALVIFDCFEVALDKAAWLAELLQYAPRLTALVTSRVCLEVSSEQVFPLSGLSVPKLNEIENAEKYEAVQLFVSLIRHRQPDRVLEDRSWASIARICQLMHGLPLGLLLASAWVGLYSLDEIANQIENSQDFLEVQWSDLPARQRSLRATFDYSWKLLSEGEQAIFRALCVFRGDFTRQAAQGVCDATPQAMLQLIDKSLVMPRAGGWYAIHPLLRQYGLEKLALLPAVSQAAHQRYSAYYLEGLAQWESDLKGAGQAKTLADLSTQIDDLHAAWAWACDQGDMDRLSRGMEGLCLYYDLSARYTEGKHACQVALDGLASLDTLSARHLQARLHIWQSHFARLLGELELAHQLREESQALINHLAACGLDTRPMQAFICLEIGEATLSENLKQACEQLSRSVDLHRQVGDPWYLAISLATWGLALQHAGVYTEAIQPLTECIAIRRASGDQHGLAYALASLAFTVARVGQFEECASLLNESIAITQAIGDKASLADELLWMARLLVWQGQFEQAFPLLEQSQPIYQDLGDHYNTIYISMVMGLGKMLAGEYQLVKPNIEMVLELGPQNHWTRETAMSHWILSGTALAEGNLPESLDQAQQSIDLYRQTGHQDELGWTLAILANIQTTLGQPEAAKVNLIEALQIAASTLANHAIMHALAAAALIFAREGQALKAVEIFAFVKEDPMWKASRWMENIVGRHVAAAAAGASPQVVSAAQERGRQRDRVEIIHEILEEFTHRGD